MRTLQIAIWGMVVLFFSSLTELAALSEVSAASQAGPSSVPSRHHLLDYKFTNELGRAVSLNDFRGQALGITFFFTRCPNPDYCPRLSRNFQEASKKLASMPTGPTNWHFLSISFDPEFDTPSVLKTYAKNYSADPARWNFLTGPPDKIAELVRLSGITIEPGGGLINHNFRTLIIDAAGHLQTAFPVGGDLSDAIVTQMVKAAGIAAPAASSGLTANEHR